MIAQPICLITIVRYSHAIREISYTLTIACIISIITIVYTIVYTIECIATIVWTVVTVCYYYTIVLYGK